MDGNASFSRLVRANSSAVSAEQPVPTARTKLRSFAARTRRGFLVNSIADKRIPWRRHMPSNRASRTRRWYTHWPDYPGRKTVSFSNLHSTKRRLPRTSAISPPPAVHLRVHFSTLLNTSYAPLSINSDLARPIFSGSTGRFLRIYMRRYHACNRPTNAFRFFPPRFSVGMIFPRDRNRTRKSDASRSRDNETEDFVWDLYS